MMMWWGYGIGKNLLKESRSWADLMNNPHLYCFSRIKSYRKEEKMSILKSKKARLIFVLAIVIIGILLMLQNNDEEQIASKIQNYWPAAYIHHIELLDDNKALVLLDIHVDEEKEVYLEKSQFSWKLLRSFPFIRDGVSQPIHFSFFQSPFNNEDQFNSVIVRVFDDEISSVQMEMRKKMIHNFQLIKKESGERFGLLRTESSELFEAEYVAYNSKGEVVFIGK